MAEVLAGIEIVDKLTDSTDKVLKLMDQMQGKVKEMMPFDTLRSVREAFAKDLDKIVELVGVEAVTAMEEQNEAMMKTLNIRQDLEGMAKRVKSNALDILDLAEVPIEERCMELIEA